MEANNEAETDALLHATEDTEVAVDLQQDCVPVDHRSDSHVIVPEMSGGFVSGNSEDDIVPHPQTLKPSCDSLWLMDDDFENASCRAAPPTRIDLVGNEPSTDSYRLTAGDSEDDEQTRLKPPSDSSWPMAGHFRDVSRAAPPTRVDYFSNESSRLSYRPHIGGLGSVKRAAPPTRITLVSVRPMKEPPPPGSSSPMDDGSPSISEPKESGNASNSSSTKERKGNTRCRRLKYLFDRFRGLLDIPRILVFGIILYVMDVSSDITAGIHHFAAGNPVWGSLTITFVILPALCWAAVSWTWWYYDHKATQPTATRDRKEMRRARMRLAILLLDPLVT